MELPKKHDFFVEHGKYTHSFFPDVYMRIQAISRTSPTTVRAKMSFHSKDTHVTTMQDCWIDIDEDNIDPWEKYGDS